jgi:sulfatase maturation enzyme AslB (radical SAM superfamily)
MNNRAHCPAIHNGLALNFKTSSSDVFASQCCLRPDQFKIDPATSFWNNPKFIPLRELNNTGEWDLGCNNCKSLEKSGSASLRTGMLSKYGTEVTLSGPRKLDLLFDISCNLACRTCGPTDSTFWQKHLNDHQGWITAIEYNRRSDDVIQTLKNINLSNLQEVCFSGGETLLGGGYWDIAEYIASVASNAGSDITLSFQSNGTQSVSEKFHNIIKKFKLVKINFSVDGTGSKFEYLRWPAKWDQVVNNLAELRSTLPSNVMFNVEETISIFNLYYINQDQQYHAAHFSTNREGDVVHHSTHLASGLFSLAAMTTEYVDAMKHTKFAHLMPAQFVEDPAKIKLAIASIKQFDQYRNQRFEDYFPEVAGFYSRYL